MGVLLVGPEHTFKNRLKFTFRESLEAVLHSAQTQTNSSELVFLDSSSNILHAWNIYYKVKDTEKLNILLAMPNSAKHTHEEEENNILEIDLFIYEYVWWDTL